MEATIQNINIYDDGVIEIVVICNHCNHKNYHTITHASKKNGDKTSIDFSKLGKRACDNHGQLKSKNICYADYNLYM